ncbi:MAG: hypothetical protein DMG01_00415 [Acidobacteria bacterium]|nr:MAG: hypothetical protein DMG01_00415 [Acidobacteriota bacterium]
MPILELVTSSSLGSLLGMRHALEPDHLAAVSTLVAAQGDERSGYKAALLGVCWGLGHTVSLLAVGAALVVLRAEMPAYASDLFELFVALMLVGLGACIITGIASTCTRARRHTSTSARGRSPAVRCSSAPCTASRAAARSQRSSSRRCRPRPRGSPT